MFLAVANDVFRAATASGFLTGFAEGAAVEEGRKNGEDVL